MRLTEEQKSVITQIVKNVKSDQQISTMGGYAGTGKSFVISFLQKVFPRFAICAYTGKATNVLRQKGISHASTIHSIIYRPTRDLNDNVIWNLATKWDLDDIDGFIIDEASMVSQEIHHDLLSFDKPIIYVGDHGQLEPIGGTKFNLMANPMYKLEQVHRNAGEIAHFAEHIRKGNPPRFFKGEHKVQIVNEKVVNSRHLANTDQVICAFNKTRVKLNNQIREEKKINFSYIAIGEKVICLRNNRSERLFNGMQGIVTKVRPKERFDFISDGEYFTNIHYNPDQFGQESNNFDFKNQAHPFDYGYALTCHKVQGSQFDNIIVYEQKCDKWDHTRWAYTAASRAINGLIWVEEECFVPTYLL
jgi:exodeoxyribonuclease-5